MKINFINLFGLEVKNFNFQGFTVQNRRKLNEINFSKFIWVVGK